MTEEHTAYACKPTEAEVRAVRPDVGVTGKGKPYDHFVKEQIAAGSWRSEWVGADVLGLARPLEILRGKRKSDRIKPWKGSNTAASYCPAHWADLAIGSGACGLRCRTCFLMMTHRVWHDPARHLLYDNLDDYRRSVERWLRAPNRRNLGLGIDCSDSLLYEGVAPHARTLIPIFASKAANPTGSKLILLTKTANTHFLSGLPPTNAVVTFSLNPEPAADAWEGKFGDGVRVTPPIKARLQAALHAQEMGFEVRWRLDPVLELPDWREMYSAFLAATAQAGHRPSRITLGTYRETQPSLLTFARGWGLPPPDFERPVLTKEGVHYHTDRAGRIDVYQFIAREIRAAWGRKHPAIALCKEPRGLREEAGLPADRCNCG